MDQKLRHAALDRAELIEPRVGGIELGREADDAVFERAERILFAAGELVALHAVGEAVEQRFNARRQSRAAAGFELFGQRADFLVERRHEIGVRCAGTGGDTFDFRRQAAHFIGQGAELLVRGDMRDDAAQAP